MKLLHLEDLKYSLDCNMCLREGIRPKPLLWHFSSSYIARRGEGQPKLLLRFSFIWVTRKFFHSFLLHSALSLLHCIFLSLSLIWGLQLRSNILTMLDIAEKLQGNFIIWLLDFIRHEFTWKPAVQFYLKHLNFFVWYIR